MTSVAVPLMVAALAAMPSASLAQALSCPLPRETPRPFIERVPADQEPVVRPVTGYILALSWSPHFCRSRVDRPREALQCRDGRFGFVLHGLWPQARGAEPRWCAYAPRLAEREIRANLCVSPSAQLIQHQWAKHGTCTGASARGYLAASRAAFAKIAFPDMAALGSDGRTTIDALRRAFAARNRWLPAQAVGVATTRGNWLAEVKLCLDAAMKPRRCDAYERGREGWRRLRITPVAAAPRPSPSRDDDDRGGA